MKFASFSVIREGNRNGRGTFFHISLVGFVLWIWNWKCSGLGRAHLAEIKRWVSWKYLTTCLVFSNSPWHLLIPAIRIEEFFSLLVRDVTPYICQWSQKYLVSLDWHDHIWYYHSIRLGKIEIIHDFYDLHLHRIRNEQWYPTLQIN